MDPVSEELLPVVALAEDGDVVLRSVVEVDGVLVDRESGAPIDVDLLIVAVGLEEISAA